MVAITSAPTFGPGGDEDGAVSVLVGRERQLAALQAAVERVRTGGSEVIVVSGSAGSGKSALLDAFARSLDDVVVAWGSYETGGGAQHDGLARALRRLVRSVLGGPDAAVEVWSRELSADPGCSIHDLARLVPELAVIDDGPPTPEDVGSDGARNRLTRSIASLLDLTSRLIGPVVIAIDNVDEATPADLELLVGVPSSTTSPVLVVVGVRSSHDSISEMWVDRRGIHPTRLELSPLTRVEIERWIRDGHGIALTSDALDQIEFRTRGNPLLVEQLVHAALDTGAARTVAGMRQLDDEWLRNQSVGDDLADVLAERLRSLPERQLRALSAAACIDGDFTVADVTAATAGDDDSSTGAIAAGLDAGLVVVHGGPSLHDRERRYRFAHERIAEVARDLLDEGTLAEVHLRLARHRLALRQPAAAVRHYASGLTSSDDPDEAAEALAVAVEAATEARGEGAFGTAHRCYVDGLRIAEHARADPDVVGDLLYGRAETARLIGSSNVDDYLDEAFRHAHDPVGRARIALLRMKVWLAAHREREALHAGIDALQELGISMRTGGSRARVAITMAHTANSLRGRSAADLANLEPATDPIALAAGQLLTELFATTYTVAQELFPFVVLKSVDLTLEYGRLPVSPIAFSGYAQLLAFMGRYDSALRYGELALRIADEPECRIYRPWTTFLFHNFIAHWRRPVRESIVPLREAFDEAMALGDHEYGGYIAAAEIAILSNSGTPLEILEHRAAELVESIPNQPKQREICEAIRQLAHNLLGWNPDPAVLAGTTGYDERIVVPRAEQDHDLVALSVHAATRLGLDYHRGDYEAAVRSAERVEQYVGGLQGTGGHTAAWIVSALARLRHDPESSATKRAVRRSDRAIEKYAAGLPDTYLAASQLIKAERAMAEGRLQRAERLFIESIRTADEYRTMLIRAQAREGVARLYTETGRPEAARGFVIDAVKIWHELGYAACVDRLCTVYPWLADSVEFDVAPREDLREPAGARDLDTIVTSLLDDVLAAARPDRCLLVLRRHETLELYAEADIDPRRTSVLDLPVPIVDDGPYEASLMRLAVRVRETVSDVRVGRDRSGPDGPGATAVAVVPVIDRNRPVAALYLERSGNERFPASVLEQVDAMARDTILSIENAYLERELSTARAHQASLEEVHARLVPTEYLEALGAADIRVLESGNTVEREWSSLFSDLRGYAALSEQFSAGAVNEIVNEFVRCIETAIVANGGFVHDTKGDEVLALFSGGPHDAVAAAIAAVNAKHQLNRDRVDRGDVPINWGVGINHGLVFLGVVDGVNHRKAGVLGDSLNLASRLEGLTKRYGSDVLVSDRIVAELPAGHRFRLRRAERVRVVSKRVPTTVYEVYDGDQADLVAAKDAAQPTLDEAFEAYDEARWDRAASAFEAVLELLPGDRIASLHLDSARRFALSGTPADWDGATTLTVK